MHNLNCYLIMINYYYYYLQFDLYYLTDFVEVVEIFEDIAIIYFYLLNLIDFLNLDHLIN